MRRQVSDEQTFPLAVQQMMEIRLGSPIEWSFWISITHEVTILITRAQRSLSCRAWREVSECMLFEHHTLAAEVVEDVFLSA